MMSLTKLIQGYSNKTLQKFNLLDKEIEDLGKTRLDICKSCDNYKNETCTLCGCDMPAKVLVPSVKCKIGEW